MGPWLSDFVCFFVFLGSVREVIFLDRKFIFLERNLNKCLVRFFEDLCCIIPMHQGFLMFSCGLGGIFQPLSLLAQCCTVLLQLLVVLRLILFPFCLLSPESARLFATREELQSGSMGAPWIVRYLFGVLFWLGCHCLTPSQQEIYLENCTAGFLLDFFLGFLVLWFGVFLLADWFDFCNAL